MPASTQGLGAFRASLALNFFPHTPAPPEPWSAAGTFWLLQKSDFREGRKEWGGRNATLVDIDGGGEEIQNELSGHEKTGRLLSE